MKRIKICLISLGCEKNLVDSEIILGMFKSDSFEIVTNRSKADVIIINTCGFIESAKKEAIDTIIDALDYQEKGIKVCACGCLVQRYLEDLKKEIPEVDLYIPIKDYYRFGELIKSLFKEKTDEVCFNPLKRYVSTPKHLAYLRISEGCNNCCTYCAIPLIRGSFVSRPVNDILYEAKALIEEGRKEICIISQDVCKYGIDLENMSLAKLLKEIVKIDGDYKIRLLYLYPDEITDELIEVVKEEDKIMPYFDIPLQHASDKILKAMNRRGSNKFVRELIAKIRKEIPLAIIRTTMIVGFPGETEEDFNILKTFIKDVKFNHLGVFTYSKEEDTVAYNMPCQIEESVKVKRYNEVMEEQKWISFQKNKELVNKEYKIVIERFDEEANKYFGRAYFLAPDDIDGEIIIDNNGNYELYKEYTCYIYDADFYDLFGRIV